MGPTVQNTGCAGADRPINQWLNLNLYPIHGAQMAIFTEFINFIVPRKIIEEK